MAIWGERAPWNGMKLTYVGVVLLGVLCLAGHGGIATSYAASSSSDDVLEEITVTARKRQESLQEVPNSIVAVDAQRLQDNAVKSLADLSSIVPGINLNSYEPNKATVSIRGVTSTNPGVGGFSPTVGFFLDDVALETVNHDLGGQAEPPFFDLQRVEVLKGPQGTLYGGSSMGGAIKFVSVDPAIDKSESKVSASVGSTSAGADVYTVSAISNIPLIAEHLALRVGIHYDYEGGYVDRIAHGFTVASEVISPESPTFLSPNAINASNVNAYTTKAARIALGIEISPSLKIKIDTTYQ
jgi:iron complex outermembrane recepter protein